MSHATLKLTTVVPKKHSVRFDTDEDDPLTNAIYINKEQAKELLGTKNLEKEKGIEITIRLIK